MALVAVQILCSNADGAGSYDDWTVDELKKRAKEAEVRALPPVPFTRLLTCTGNKSA